MTKSQLPQPDKPLAGYSTCLQNPTEASPTHPTSSPLYHTSISLSLSLSLLHNQENQKKKGDRKRGLVDLIRPFCSMKKVVQSLLSAWQLKSLKIAEKGLFCPILTPIKFFLGMRVSS
jgi:hypothetical protein